ncbi:MAG: flagellar biosynthetic protein FliQ [Planctomycetes bacterium]|nr:flagellar biosynthetic protein FliQ [Planctomycetota bacterium]
MDGDMVIYLARRTLETALLLAAPVLAVTLVLGILVAMIQAVTSLRDMTMGLVLKMAGVGVTMLVTAGWALQVAVGFTQEIFNHLQALGH